MFYHQVNGIILVHDVSNRKSYHNLWRWIAEVLHSEAYKDNEKSWVGSASGGIKKNGKFLIQRGSDAIQTLMVNVKEMKDIKFKLEIKKVGTSLYLTIQHQYLHRSAQSV